MEEGEGELRAIVIIKKEVVKWGAHEKEKEGEIEEMGGARECNWRARKKTIKDLTLN